MNFPPEEFTFHMAEGREQLEKTTDGPDFFDEFLSNAKLAGAIGGRHGSRIAEEFQGEASQRDAAYGAIYKNIARAASESPLQKTADEWERPVGDGAALAKRKSATTSDGYRDWLTKIVARGESATEAVDKWCAQHPNHNPAIATELRSIAASL
jgi:hypothetical protein